MPPLRHLAVQLLVVLLLVAVDPSMAQRPFILNHTFSSLPMSQHPSFNTWPGSSGKQLRNGRLHEQPLPLPQPTLPVATQYVDYETAPPGSRRQDSKRRQSLAQLASRPGSIGRGGIDSLRKELMNPSVGGPGGGISGHGAGYSSYPASSTIGRIDGLGHVGTFNHFGEPMRQPTGMAAMTAGPYSTRFPPSYGGADDLPKRMPPRKNSINELYKLKKSLNQADEPAGGVTHGNLDGDPQAASVDPLQEIKDRIRDTAPIAVS